MANVLTVQQMPPGSQIEIKNTGQPPIKCLVAAEAAGAMAQLTNTRFVDVATAVPLADQTGTIGAPFHTITQAVAALAVTGGTIMLNPGDYTPEGPITINSANNFSLINLAGLQIGPNSGGFDFSLIVLPVINGTAGKLIQGCACTGDIIATAGAITLIGCGLDDSVNASLYVNCFDCLFDKANPNGKFLITAGDTMSLNSCNVAGAGDFASLVPGDHQITSCTFSRGTGNIVGSDPGVIVNYDGMSFFNYMDAFGPAFDANSNPRCMNARETRLAGGGAVVVPALAAGELAYVDASIAVVGLPAIQTGTPCTVQTPFDLAAAGAGAGFLAGARISAPDTVRLTFVGALVGGASTFVVALG